MIRTLVILAIVSFLLSVGCLAAAFAIAGGPFYIDENWRFHRSWDVDISASTWNTDEARIYPQMTQISEESNGLAPKALETPT